MSDEKKFTGMWTDKACAYSDIYKRCPVLAARPNGVGEAYKHGYLYYLSFEDGKVHFQVGPVMGGGDYKKLKRYEVPQEVAEAAIHAAVGTVLLWQQSSAETCHTPPSEGGE